MACSPHRRTRGLAPSTAWVRALAGALLLAVGPGLAGIPAAEAATPPLSVPRTAPRPAPGLELQALRDALLEQAREARTRVRALSWIDADGRLYESSSFHSELDVRAVRVLAPVNPQDAALRARLTLDAPDARPDGRPDLACTREPGRWQSPWRWQQRVQGGDALEASALYALGQVLQGRMAAAGRTDGPPLQDDEATPLSHPAEGTPRLTTAYARALTGRAGVATPPPLGRLSLHLSLLPSTRWLAPAQLQVELRLQRADGRLLWQDRAVWAWPDLQLDAAGARVDAALLQAVSAWAVQHGPAVHARWRCEPPVWAAQALQGDRLEVLAGPTSGLQAGDRLLLAPPALLPTRTLEPDALDSLAVAEVLQVRGDRIEARLAAGPVRMTPGPWRAWPY